MKLTRFLLIVVYMGYLINAGLMLVLLPWSGAWGLLLTHFSPTTAIILDSPWIRGLLSAFGVLHLMLVAWELINPTLLAATHDSRIESQNKNQS